MEDTGMRAMQIIEWGKPLEAREYPDPEPTGEEVLLRVEAAGVCHSDVHIWDGFFDLGDGRQISLESRGVRLQDFLAMQLPESRFDGVFANASLFHLPSEELPRVL